MDDEFKFGGPEKVEKMQLRVSAFGIYSYQWIGDNETKAKLKG